MRTSVLVVGAGPAGLTAAIALARHGVDVTVVERRHEHSELPRATAVSIRTMELMRSWGLEERLRARAVDVEWRVWVGPTLADAGESVPVSFPTREQSAVLSPVEPAWVPQDHLEPVLLEHLRSLGPARVLSGTEVTDLQVRADGADVTLLDVATARTRVVRAGHVIAADGIRSHVRELVGIGRSGPGRLSQAVSTLFRAPLSERLRDRRHCYYAITHPDVAGVLVPSGKDDRWVYGVTSEVDGPPAAPFTPEEATRRLRFATGMPDLQPLIERSATFTFAAQLADTFRAGPVFLTGDAAHQVTPRGGTGMNTAIQSAYDLGWKLAWVLRGWAGPALLDTYESERRPVAAHNVARSADPLGDSRPVEQELRADLGGRIPHVWLAPGVSTLDLLGPGLTLFVSDAVDGWSAAAAAIAAPPIAVRRIDALVARGLGMQPGGALLVRPDGAPAGWWPRGTEPVGALRVAAAAIADAAIAA